jgi:hypothetical protein
MDGLQIIILLKLPQWILKVSREFIKKMLNYVLHNPTSFDFSIPCIPVD